MPSSSWLRIGDRLGLRADQHDRRALVVGGDRFRRHPLLRALHQHQRVDQPELDRLGADLLDGVGGAGPRDDVEVDALVLVVAALLAEIERRVLRAALPVEPDLHLGGVCAWALNAPSIDQRERSAAEPK